MPRVQVIEKTVFKFSELENSAKDKAISKFYSDEFPEMDHVIEDAVRMADIIGIDIRTKAVKLMNGSFRNDPVIYWSGFSSQGDGASFEGSYQYKKGSVANIKSECNDATLIRICEGLANIQKTHFYSLSANISREGRYSHSGTMRVSVEYSRDYERDISEAESDITDYLREFADWIYSSLEKEYEYQTSEEVFAETCEANDYEFDESGNLV